MTKHSYIIAIFFFFLLSQAPFRTGKSLRTAPIADVVSTTQRASTPLKYTLHLVFLFLFSLFSKTKGKTF